MCDENNGIRLGSQGIGDVEAHPRRIFVNPASDLLKYVRYFSAIGVYAYKDEIRIENDIPPIVEPEVFYKVQEMLKYNQKTAAHKNSKWGIKQTFFSKTALP